MLHLIASVSQGVVLCSRPLLLGVAHACLILVSAVHVILRRGAKQPLHCQEQPGCQAGRLHFERDLFAWLLLPLHTG
jgi:hypothetical protein